MLNMGIVNLVMFTQFSEALNGLVCQGLAGNLAFDTEMYKFEGHDENVESEDSTYSQFVLFHYCY